MEQTLQAMGNTVGSAFAYFAFVLQIISKFLFIKFFYNFYSKHDVGILCIRRAQIPIPQPADHFALSRFQFVSHRARA